MGMIVEAARDREGNLAPTMLKLLTERRFDDKARAALERFTEKLLNSDIVVADVHPGNLVYAHNEEEGDHFVLIDGIGATTLIPLKVWSRRANLASKRKKIAKLRRAVGRYS